MCWYKFQPTRITFGFGYLSMAYLIMLSRSRFSSRLNKHPKRNFILPPEYRSFACQQIQPTHIVYIHYTHTHQFQTYRHIQYSNVLEWTNEQTNEQATKGEHANGLNHQFCRSTNMKSIMMIHARTQLISFCGIDWFRAPHRQQENG